MISLCLGDRKHRHQFGNKISIVFNLILEFFALSVDLQECRKSSPLSWVCCHSFLPPSFKQAPCLPPALFAHTSSPLTPKFPASSYFQHSDSSDRSMLPGQLWPNMPRLSYTKTYVLHSNSAPNTLHGLVPVFQCSDATRFLNFSLARCKIFKEISL